MAPKFLTTFNATVLHLALRAFLLVASFWHGGLILWSMAYDAYIPEDMGFPYGWGKYLSPFGADSSTFRFYLSALILNLAWDGYWVWSLGGGPESRKPGYIKPGIAAYHLGFWVLLAAFSLFTSSQPWRPAPCFGPAKKSSKPCSFVGPLNPYLLLCRGLKPKHQVWVYQV